MLAVVDADLFVQDGVPFRAAAASNATFIAEFNSLQGDDLWLPADCSGNPCNTAGLVDPLSVPWFAVSTLSTSSASRTNADSDTASDWSVGAAASWGIAPSRRSRDTQRT
jgi:hypothetical protein